MSEPGVIPRRPSISAERLAQALEKQGSTAGSSTSTFKPPAISSVQVVPSSPLLAVAAPMERPATPVQKVVAVESLQMQSMLVQEINKQEQIITPPPPPAPAEDEPRAESSYDEADDISSDVGQLEIAISRLEKTLDKLPSSSAVSGASSATATPNASASPPATQQKAGGSGSLPVPPWAIVGGLVAWMFLSSVVSMFQS